MSDAAPPASERAYDSESVRICSRPLSAHTGVDCRRARGTSSRFATSYVISTLTAGVSTTSGAWSGPVWKLARGMNVNVPVPEVSKSYSGPRPVWLTATEDPAGMVMYIASNVRSRVAYEAAGVSGMLKQEKTCVLTRTPVNNTELSSLLTANELVDEPSSTLFFAMTRISLAVGLETTAVKMMSSTEFTDGEIAFKETVKSPEERPSARALRLRMTPARNILKLACRPLE